MKPSQKLSLKENWNWAQKEAQKDSKNGYWIGYMIKKQMSSNCFIGSYSNEWKKKKSLYELIYHIKPKLDPYKKLNFDGTIHGSFHVDGNGQKMEREMALLFYYDADNYKPSQFSDSDLSHMELCVNLKEKPLYWLGEIEQKESFNFLKVLFNQVEHTKNKEDLLVTMAMHDVKEAFSFLSDIALSHDDIKLRHEATFWLSQIDDPQALNVLEKVVKTDPASKVRKQAVFAIHEVNSPDAIKLLISLAKNTESYQVQKEAIFWLGQRASEIATQSLEEIVYSDETTELKKQAIIALSEQKNYKTLIKIAKNHPNAKVRKQAIFWLGESGDKQAVDALIQMVEEII